MTDRAERIRGRIAAAAARASARYSGPISVRSGSRTSEAVPAVKRCMPPDVSIEPLGALTVRRAEFILASDVFNALAESLAWNAPPTQQDVRDAVVIEENGREWKIDSARPFLENDPADGSVRIFGYRS